MTGTTFVKPPRMSEGVLRHLMAEIVRGEYAAGEMLPPEPELCHRLGVSRTVVREALGILASKGLVSIEHGRGTRVRDPQLWNSLDPLLIEVRQQSGKLGEILEELLEVRRIVEVQIAGLAAARATAELVEELRLAADALAASRGVGEDYLQAEIRFHEALARCARNSLLHGMLAPTSELFKITLGMRGTEFAVVVRHHRAIYDAVAAHDRDAACRAMEVVVANFERNIRHAMEGTEPSASTASHVRSRRR